MPSDARSRSFPTARDLRHNQRPSGGDVEKSVVIPPEAIDGASSIFVRVYPGTFSQIVDGLDSMLRMRRVLRADFVATYPNVLVTDYMKRTKQINPELQMKAEGFINTGYQRLRVL